MKIGIQLVPPQVEFITPKHIPNWVDAFSGIIEECGRNCYQSEPRRGDTAARFIKRHRIHESILEHGVFTVNFIGSRSMSHQLVRHRIAAYSQESQRFCDYQSDRLQEVVDDTPDEHQEDGIKFLRVILPPSILTGNIKEMPEALTNLKIYQELGSLVVGSGRPLYQFLDQQFGNNSGAIASFKYWCTQRIHNYEEYLHWRNEKVPPEDARSCLPNATKTSVMTTYNFRIWRHVLGHPVFGRALNEHAQWEIRGLMLAVLDFFEKEIPYMFGDLRNG